MVPDTRPDSPGSMTCYQKWLANTIQLDTPVVIAEINSSVFDRDPFLLEDELTIYISSGRNGTDGDLYVATRTSLTTPFSTPVPAYEFNSLAEETKLSITSDHRIAVAGSARPNSPNMLIEVWESIRLATTDNWPAMNQTNVAMVETSGNDHDPTISADGQRLYLSPDTPAPQHLSMATRAGNGKFGTPVAITALNTTDGEADPSP